MSKLKFFTIMVILIFIDQATKFGIVSNRNNLPKTIIDGMITFTYCENRGIAFGLASGHVRILSIVTLIIIMAIIIGICRHFKRINKIYATGTVLLIAGGIGNFIDRAFRLFVVDFIDIGDFINFPIFNFADICVVVGVAVIGVACVIGCRRDSIENNNC